MPPPGGAAVATAPPRNITATAAGSVVGDIYVYITDFMGSWGGHTCRDTARAHCNGLEIGNGFRAGYLSKIENNLHAEFPNMDLKGTPHINSKILPWKKTEELWLSTIHFESKWGGQRCQILKWKSIFGKDRASGGVAEELDAVVARLRAQVS
ncbi:hypothetical protein SASPL_148640 [Salvia splendens]|uniref:Uncharacterized protein n=1 Tax=Salvia splendens TaxID=180675 RepID=A0A8X8WA34_SALSN|nr:hypothetical protein SASPL_148640 [Salvia splendens]